MRAAAEERVFEGGGGDGEGGDGEGDGVAAWALQLPP